MIQFDLVTPEKQFFSKTVEMVVIPALEGDMGIMASHMPIVTTLAPGVVRIYKGDTIEDVLFVTGGVAETKGEKITVLADRAMMLSEIDFSTISERIHELQASIQQKRDALETPEHEREIADLERELSISQAKLSAVNDYSK